LVGPIVGGVLGGVSLILFSAVIVLIVQRRRERRLTSSEPALAGVDSQVTSMKPELETHDNRHELHAVPQVREPELETHYNRHELHAVHIPAERGYARY
jgi:hypothetical protein